MRLNKHIHIHSISAPQVNKLSNVLYPGRMSHQRPFVRCALSNRGGLFWTSLTGRTEPSEGDEERKTIMHPECGGQSLWRWGGWGWGGLAKLSVPHRPTSVFPRRKVQRSRISLHRAICQSQCLADYFPKIRGIFPVECNSLCIYFNLLLISGEREQSLTSLRSGRWSPAPSTRGRCLLFLGLSLPWFILSDWEKFQYQPKF